MDLNTRVQLLQLVSTDAITLHASTEKPTILFLRINDVSKSHMNRRFCVHIQSLHDLPIEPFYSFPILVLSKLTASKKRNFENTSDLGVRQLVIPAHEHKRAFHKMELAFLANRGVEYSHNSLRHILRDSSPMDEACSSSSSSSSSCLSPNVSPDRNLKLEETKSCLSLTSTLKSNTTLLPSIRLSEAHRQHLDMQHHAQVPPLWTLPGSKLASQTINLPYNNKRMWTTKKSCGLQNDPPAAEKESLELGRLKNEVYALRSMLCKYLLKGKGLNKQGQSQTTAEDFIHSRETNIEEEASLTSSHQLSSPSSADENGPGDTLTGEIKKHGYQSFQNLLHATTGSDAAKCISSKVSFAPQDCNVRGDSSKFSRANLNGPPTLTINDEAELTKFYNRL
jgi:hypothetical protein